MFCGQCGVRNLVGSRFCESCGTRLVVPMEERPIVPSEISRRRKKYLIGLLGVLLLAAILFAGWMIMDVQSTRAFNDAMDNGNRYLLAENLEQAEAHFLRAIEINPREVEPYLRLADIYMTWGEPEEAIAILEQGLEAVPEEERQVLKDVLDEIINSEDEIESEIRDLEIPPIDDELNRGNNVAGDNQVFVALIAQHPDSILDDGSFNESAWQGIQRFLSNNNSSQEHTAIFLTPRYTDDVGRIVAVEDAIEMGANIIVLPGFHFIDVCAEVQERFPEIKFIMLDGTPMDGPANNTVAIHFDEEQAGFLAGYAAVMEGYRTLGFLGGVAIPTVVRYGHGFLLGADYAATSLGLAPGEVVVNYYYLESFAPSPEARDWSLAWSAAGVEVIFAAAGGGGISVMEAADSAGFSVIGVDSDQSGASDAVITSAVKAIDVPVYDMLTDFMNGSFPGGRELLYDASKNGVGLSMDSSRFHNFTQAQYDEIFARLADRSLVIINTIASTVSEANLNLSVVEVIDFNSL